MWAAAIFTASSIPSARLPAPAFSGADKLVHVAIFALLGWLVARASRRGPAAALGAGAYGALDELHQRFTPGRFMDPWDALADLVGASAGAAAWALGETRSRRRDGAAS